MTNNNKNYNRTKIYKIWSLLGDKVYIGSTTKEFLSQRMATHRNGYQNWKRTNKKYTTSFILFEEYGVENCLIELLEEKECKDINEARQLEGGYIRALDCVNKRIAGRPDKESMTEHYNKNKDSLISRANEYYKKNKDTIRARQNEYYKNNKEELQQKQREYRKKRKEQKNNNLN